MVSWNLVERRLPIAMLGAIALLQASCSQHPVSHPGLARPVDGAAVEVGSLVQSGAVVSLDVLLPADGDIPAALESARTNAKRDGLSLVDSPPTTASQPVITIQLKSFADEGWANGLPGYVVSKIDPDTFPEVQWTAGIVRLEARAPASRAWDLLRTVTAEARELATVQHGWIYDAYRAELHDEETFAASLPQAQMHDVRAVTRIIGVVSTKGGLDHVRTIGLWRLGLPELYLPDVAHERLDDATALVRATAQTLVQGGGVTRRGVLEVDLSKLPADWPKPGSGTGRFTWRARWMRGPIHQNAMLIVLSTPGALSAALHEYTGE